MLSWMFYSMVASLLMGLAALAFERSAQIRGRPTRWLWAMCMLASVAVLLIPARESVQLPETTHFQPATSSRTIPAPSTVISTETPRLTLPTIGDDQAPLSEAVSTLLDWTWRIASMALALAIFASGIH